RSRNSGSKPRGYPFKMKAALASLAVADGCAIPVIGGFATGADAPNHDDVPRLCGPANGTSSIGRRRLAAAPNQVAGLLAGPNAEQGRLSAKEDSLRLIGA